MVSYRKYHPLKYIINSVLILLLMMQTSNTWFVVMAFRINIDYIKANLCENRDRPKLKCGGNCVLMKKLKEKESKEQDPSGSSRVEFSLQILSSKSFFATVETVEPDSQVTYCSPANSSKPVDNSLGIFHPPSA
ncbi:hypothetical protein [Pollutibacter soli]|uniref:hypothetical protein n=1 Tax=Pollutibacter soli TaxID=3034157 RepID=UPI0030132CEA